MATAPVLAIVLLASLALAPAAWAHPFIDATDPASLSSAPVGTESVTVWYSEGVELDFSSLEVLDSAGERVDNGDTAYHEGDSSLRVTTPPLEEGVYTVSSKVLSRVDGHLVGSAFIFAVGDATIDAAAAESVAPAAQVFLAEAIARLPGMAGQVVVLGAAAGLLLVWGTRREMGIAEGAAGILHRSRFMVLVGAGSIAVLASNIFILAAHASSLNASILDAAGTAFGGTIMIRMAITAALIVAWFAAERRRALSPGWAAAFAAFGLGLAATTTMIGHGAATELPAAAALDYAHNIVAGVWIGGVAYLLVALLPAVQLAGKKADDIVRALVPTFSAVFVACVALAAITGPLLLWLLEDELALIAGSTYGAVLAAKIGIAISMVLLGAYNWRSASRAPGGRPLASRLRASLRIEACLGLALLAAVALLTNTTLPGGEALAEAPPGARAGLDAKLFSSGAAFEVSVWPLAAGPNDVRVSVSGPDGEPLADLEEVRVKAASPQRGIPPIGAAIGPEGGAYSGELTLGFWGPWEIEVEAVRSESANESVTAGVLLKPDLSDLEFEITEYDLPEGASPLHIVHDGDSTVWLSDPASPRVWSFDVRAGEFAEHALGGSGSVVLSLDQEGRVWFTDIGSSSIGFLDPAAGTSESYRLPPSLWGTGGDPIPVWIEAARSGDVWVSVPNKDSVVRYDPGVVILEGGAYVYADGGDPVRGYDPGRGRFEAHAAPAPGTAPFAVAEDAYGTIWFTGQAGSLARLDPATGDISEIPADPPLDIPETITFGPEGGLWISEHAEGGGIARLDPASGEFERIASPLAGALANSVSFDAHQNAWFALHTVDALAVYNPASGRTQTVGIPTEGSWVQFTAADDNGDIWFAEQRPAKLGVVRISEPALVPYERPGGGPEAGYGAIAAPLMAGVLVGAGLLFAGAMGRRREALAGLAR